MYTVRRFHPKSGTYTFITIGDAYEHKQPPNDRFKKKQFQTNPPKHGQTEGYFTKMTYSTESYKDTNEYIKLEPLNRRRKGFGSRDARKRDEFTQHIRQQQWKELVDREVAFQNSYRSAREAAGEPTMYSRVATARDDFQDRELRKQQVNERRRTQGLPTFFQTQVPSLYDIGREGIGTTPICNKCARETFYCKHRVGRGMTTARRVSPRSTSAQVVGYGASRVAKPAFGRISHVKEFNDAGHLISHAGF